MKKPLDKITEAYFGERGEAFSEKVRTRIHWVCENAKGEKILDVGCSQGITSILLGREGKQVLGVDLLAESIEYANEMLEKEEEITKQYVKFMAGNFMLMDFKEETYDCIILGEVLEHITDPVRFLNKAVSLLNTNGTIIITLPFGINDYFDHKKTYYVHGLFGFQEANIVMQDIRIFGKWIGAIYKKQGEEQKKIELNLELLEELEKAFYDIERNLTDYKKNNSAKKVSKAESSENSKMLAEYKEMAIEAKKEKIKLQEELLHAYKDQEQLLKYYRQLERKYKALSNSKLGKLTLSIWNKRKSGK